MKVKVYHVISFQDNSAYNYKYNIRTNFKNERIKLNDIAFCNSITLK